MADELDGSAGRFAAIPVLLVRDVAAAARWWADALGFRIDFLHGKPPFYGAVSRDGARLHLRFVHEPMFAGLAAQEEALIAAMIEVSDVEALFGEVATRGADVVQQPTRQPWGGIDFHVRDPDGNVLRFAELPAARAR